jgi:hypothetical protein
MRQFLVQLTVQLAKTKTKYISFYDATPNYDWPATQASSIAAYIETFYLIRAFVSEIRMEQHNS